MKVGVCDDLNLIAWKPDSLFQAVQVTLGVCDDLDVIASTVNQLDRYVAWQPDPCAWQIDAFPLYWSEFLPR